MHPGPRAIFLADLSALSLELQPTPVVSTNLPFVGVEIFRRYRFTDDSIQVLKSENNLLRPHLSRHFSKKGCRS